MINNVFKDLVMHFWIYNNFVKRLYSSQHIVCIRSHLEYKIIAYAIHSSPKFTTCFSFWLSSTTFVLLTFLAILKCVTNIPLNDNEVSFVVLVLSDVFNFIDWFDLDLGDKSIFNIYYQCLQSSINLVLLCLFL